MGLPDRERRFRPGHPVDLRLTLLPLWRGRGDPCMRLDRQDAWRATRTPEGAATVHVATRQGEVLVGAWGPGADWACHHAPELVGAEDDASLFRPRHPMLAELHRRWPGLRIPRSRAVFEAIVPSILEQKVQGIMARRSYAAITRRWGERAPGPFPLRLPPGPDVLGALPSYAFHPLQVERKRADTIRLAARHARRLDEAVELPLPDAYRRLTVLPGLGAWTAAEVATVALGDADAVSVGDYHLPNTVSWALAREPRGDDERMLELLQPYAGHRGRVLRLLGIAGIKAPAYGPRLALHPITHL